MGLEVGLLAASTLLGAGGTAYSARQQKKAGNQAEAAAKDAAKLSQTQQNTPVDQYRKTGRTKRGFDPVIAALTPGGTGADLLGS
jgi:hypothetical protein